MASIDIVRRESRCRCWCSHRGLLWDAVDLDAMVAELERRRPGRRPFTVLNPILPQFSVESMMERQLVGVVLFSENGDVRGMITPSPDHPRPGHGYG